MSPGDYALPRKDTHALVKHPEDLASLLLALPQWQRALVQAALAGADTPALASAAELQEHEVPAHLALLVRHLRVTGWDDPVFTTRPVRRALQRMNRKRKE